MAKDDVFKIIYVLLTELYGHMKDGTKIKLEDISPERFHIPESYMLSILSDLLNEGYIRGPLVRQTKTGAAVSGMEDIEITLKGIEYLQNNSTMKKIYETLKEIRDWVPGF